MIEDLAFIGLMVGIDKVSGAIRDHREKRFIKFRKEADKKRTSPYCLFGKYEGEDGRYSYIFTDVNGVIKYYSDKAIRRTKFILFSASDKKKVGIVKFRNNLLKFRSPSYKGIQIYGVSSGRIMKETIDIDRKQYLIVGGGKQTTITEKDGTIIARITNSMDLYMIEYTDIKYEILALLFCISEHVFYDVDTTGD